VIRLLTMTSQCCRHGYGVIAAVELQPTAHWRPDHPHRRARMNMKRPASDRVIGAGRQPHRPIKHNHTWSMIIAPRSIIKARGASRLSIKFGSGVIGPGGPVSVWTASETISCRVGCRRRAAHLRHIFCENVVTCQTSWSCLWRSGDACRPYGPTRRPALCPITADSRPTALRQFIIDHAKCSLYSSVKLQDARHARVPLIVSDG